MKVRFFVALMASCALGCGGSSDVGINGPSPDASVNDGASGDGGSTGDGATGIDGATDGAPSDGATADASPGSPDGGSPLDAGPGGNTQTVSCGNTACLIGSQVCCVTQLQTPPPPFSYGCVNGTACPNANDTALACSSSANCPLNQICCVEQVGNTIQSACATSCTNNGAQLCDPRAMPTGCPMGVQCSSANIGDWGLPPTYATCGGKPN